jgi:hypothetical protein
LETTQKIAQNCADPVSSLLERFHTIESEIAELKARLRQKIADLTELRAEAERA